MMAFHGKAGDRVQMVFMPNDPDDPDPIPAGATGTVVGVHDMPWGQDRMTQVMVKWDNGRNLSCICPPDHLEIIQSAAVNIESSRRQ